MNLLGLEAFLRVVELGSITRAAGVLDVPKSTVSRRIRRLEEELGVQLLVRKSRGFAISEAGHRLAQRCSRPMRAISEAAEALADGDEPVGTLRLSVGFSLGTTPLFTNFVASFLSRYPEVKLHVRLETARVDLIAEGYDFALRGHPGQLPDSSELKGRVLNTSRAAMFGSPGYLAGAPPLVHPDDLIHHRVLLLQMGGEREHVRLGLADQPASRFPVMPVVLTDDLALITASAVAGVGLAFLPLEYAQPHLDSGALARVLPSWDVAMGRASLLWPVQRFETATQRAFIDHAIEYFQGKHRAT